MLSALIWALIVIQHSNADCEQVFSVVHKNRDGTRSSTTMDTLSILLACKSNLFSGDTTCHNFQPSTDLLRKCKSATLAKLK